MLVEDSSHPALSTGEDPGIDEATAPKSKKRARDEASNISGSVGTQRSSEHKIAGDAAATNSNGASRESAEATIVADDDDNNGDKEKEVYDGPICPTIGFWKPVETTQTNAGQDSTPQGIEDISEPRNNASTPGKVAIGTKVTVSTQGDVKVSQPGGRINHPAPLETSTEGEIDVADEQKNIGIILRYHRTQNVDVRVGGPDTSTSKEDISSNGLVPYGGEETSAHEYSMRRLGGIDRVFIKFGDRHEWVDYWAELIV